jgi:conjugal transfer ATP-binding protein TraC
MKKEKQLNNLKTIDSKIKYQDYKMMKKRIKNSTAFSNIKEVTEEGLINLKSNEVACLLEIKAIDLSLTSNQEKQIFFNMLKVLYQIPNLNMKCYKLDEKLNLNANKDNLDKKIEKYNEDISKKELLQEERNLIDDLESKNFTVSSKYFWILIAKDTNILNKQIGELEEITSNIIPKIDVESITNKLEVYKFLSNLYITSNSLDELVWSDLPSLVSPINISEKIDKLKFDNDDVQMLTVKNIPPFVSELFFEDIFNYPDVRASISIKECITQEELIRWVNREYQFLLTDRSSTKKLSDATELDTQKENFQVLMNDIKNGDEKIKEVSLILAVVGDKEHREEIIRDLKRIADNYQIKLDIPRLRQMEAWQCYDISTKSFNDYAFYLPTMTLSAGFPFTKTYFNDSTGYMLGVDIHTSLPIFFDLYTLNNSRTSHNMAIISSTGGGKSYTMKKMIVNEYARGTKIFIFDAENEYKKIVENNNGEYIDLYSKTGGIINPLQIRFIPSDDDNHDTKETDCPLAKHLGFLEAFFKTAFESISEKELIMLLAIVEKLYNKKGIFKNTSINTLQNMKPEEYPIFSELYNFLPEYKESVKSKEEAKIIEQLDILLSRFLTGTDSYLFDGYTNINLDNNLIAFNLQELLYSGNQRLINTQTLNLLTYLNNSIVANKINNDKLSLEDKKHVMIIADEFHLFIDEDNPEVLRNFGQLARRIRKYSGSLVVATQSIKDFVGSSSILRHSTAIFNNCQYQMIGMLKEDDLLAYLELFKQNPLTDTQKKFLMSARRGEFLLNIDSKNRLRIWIRATELERQMMGEN